MHFFRFIALLSALISSALALEKYQRGPIALGTDAILHYSLNKTTKTIAFALVVNNSIINDDAKSAWSGIGISEPTSGSMLGADIASVEFRSNAVDNCELVDRHVPFAAYPLIEQSANASGVFPEKDSCQDDGSWTLVSCKRDSTANTITFEVTRALDAHDKQDRAIEAGEQTIIYAYGSGGLSYHGTLRGGRALTLFNEDMSLPEATEIALPDDVVRSQTVTMPDYKVPSDRVTTYACYAQDINSTDGKNVTMVAADVVLETKSGPNVSHHMLVYVCPKDKMYNELKSTGPQSCGGEGELQNPAVFCTGLVYSWAVGIGRFVVPEDVGFVLNPETEGIVIEVHYDNKERKANIVDNTGAVLHYAKSRPVEAGTLWAGDPTITLGGQTVEHNKSYAMSCPKECTGAFQRSINVFGSFLHMHTTGRRIDTARYDKNGSFVEEFLSIDFWSNDHQKTTIFKKPKVVQPGDTLTTTCVFDTRKRPKTKFGLETKDEMCMDIMFYYPRQDVSAVKGETVVQPGGTLLRCGILRGRNTTETSTICGHKFLPVRNPTTNASKDDSTFGMPGSCPRSPTVSPSPSTLPSPTPACFPSDVTVMSEDGRQLSMSDVEIGDRVHVGSGEFAEVFAFTHRDPDIDAQFVRIDADDNMSLTLTPGHYIYANGVLLPAAHVRIGDALRKAANGDEVIVRNVQTVRGKGLYNPQTTHGDIAVNGMLASTYTTTIRPKAAHAMLAPLRAVAQRLGLHMTALYGWDSLTV